MSMSSRLDQWEGRIGGLTIAFMIVFAIVGLFLALMVEVFMPVHDEVADQA